MTNQWIDVVKEMPDDEQCVLIALADGEVWTGYHESDNAGEWFYPSADRVDIGVTHWMPFPKSPIEP